MEKLLIVDDDLTFAGELQRLMQSHGWAVEMCHRGFDGLQLLANFKFDFVLLDWNLPDMTGLEICRKFRQSGGHTPIIFLTGRHGIDDKELGLDSGGDDYLTKPFDVRELLARMRTIKRRPAKIEHDALTFAGGSLDPYFRKLKYKDTELQLSPSENNILEFLLRNRNSFYTSDQLLNAIWPSDAETSRDTVRVHMTFLRRKLTKVGLEDLIKTVRNSGYIIEDPGAKA